MIRKIELQNVPPYLGETQVVEPRKVNFVFGLNGSGKTTFSQYLRSPKNSEYADCHLDWSGKPIECAVYNRDYVKENFNESTVPGIFTLGAGNIKAKAKIDELSHEIKELTDRITTLKNNLEGTEGSEGLRCQLDLLEDRYADCFWSIKQTFDKRNSALLLALEGVRGSKEAFKARLLQQKASNTAEIMECSELEELCIQLFGKENERLATIASPEFESLIQYAQNPLLSKVVVGKADVDIADLIRKLGIDAWVSQGVTYLDRSDGKCPFCQKTLDADFQEKIAEYFDQTYTAAVQEISRLVTAYAQNSSAILGEINALIENRPRFLKVDELTLACQKLERVFETNKEILSKKQSTPNIIVTLAPIHEIANSIKNILLEANQEICKYNNRIEHIKEERVKTIDLVWRYILETLSDDLITYVQRKEFVSNSIAQAENEIKEIDEKIASKDSERRLLERQLTSIIPTAEGINEVLKNYGFTCFALKVDDENKSYQFVRSDGTPAYNSLSEGERNLVTFLYFMYSLRGNAEDSGHNVEKIVMIDDPVSSLDNDVLFLVSSMIRDLFRSVYDGSNSIKQLFVLSHNLYFFKEVSYHKGLKKQETGFWMITKADNISKITYYYKNPVSSTYEMLWDEVRNANSTPVNHNTTALANTMRRILEYYFRFLGGMDLNQFHLQFPDGERQVFKSLITWANAGSHSEFDDYSATPNIYNTGSYLKVFKDLFEKTRHIAHYNMMMRFETEEQENG